MSSGFFGLHFWKCRIYLWSLTHTGEVKISCHLLHQCLTSASAFGEQYYSKSWVPLYYSDEGSLKQLFWIFEVETVDVLINLLQYLWFIYLSHSWLLSFLSTCSPPVYFQISCLFLCMTRLPFVFFNAIQLTTPISSFTHLVPLYIYPPSTIPLCQDCYWPSCCRLLGLSLCSNSPALAFALLVHLFTALVTAFSVHFGFDQPICQACFCHAVKPCYASKPE